MSRLTFDWTEPGWDGGEIAVTTTGDHVNVAVTQEKAVDTCNATFTCAVNLPEEQAAELWRVLGLWLAARPSADPRPQPLA